MTPSKPADTVLALDVGNTRLGVAIFDADGIHNVRRVAIGDDAGWRSAIAEVWSGIPESRTPVAVMASVNPAAAERVVLAVRGSCGVETLRVGAEVPLPMPLEIENAREVGVDRVCSAAAAFDRIKKACAVASFGTAHTVDCVSHEGHFLGGAILPGLEMSYEALYAHTAALPRVQSAAPNGPFGRNTHDAIINGVVYGAVGALREIVERYATELGEWPQLVVTGGSAAVVTDLADFVDAVVPDLCLIGIALAYRRHAGQP